MVRMRIMIFQMASPSTASSRRNSTAGGSRRGSLESEGGGFPFRLKKSKPTSQVKIVFMGKPLVTALGASDNFLFFTFIEKVQLKKYEKYRPEHTLSKGNGSNQERTLLLF